MSAPKGAANQTLEKAVVEIDGEQCKGCELCRVVCPRGCLDLDRTIFNTGGFHPARFTYLGSRGACTACGICYMVCPDFAIAEIRKLKKE